MEKIAAIVVTYNRKEMLLENLNALIKQELKPNAIYIIDGPSTDGTPEFLYQRKYIEEKPPKECKKKFWQTKGKVNGVEINYFRLYEDIGGAGGFNFGIKQAYKDGYYWFWLMDDDSEPKRAALKNLIEKYKKIKRKYKKINVGFLCSKVLWIDGTLNTASIPAPSSRDSLTEKLVPFNLLDEFCVSIVSACTFVSVLINRDAIKKVGLPYMEFFIWYDDIEYTKRITKNGFVGVYIPESIVIHKTKDNNARPNIYSDESHRARRYFYNSRNVLFLWRKKSLLKYLMIFVYYLLIVNTKIILKRKDSKLKFIIQNTKGTLASLIFNPKIEKV